MSLDASAPTHRPHTTRQEDVWALLAANQSDAQIAHALGSKPETVKTDIKRLKAKRGVETTAELEIACRWSGIVAQLLPPLDLSIGAASFSHSSPCSSRPRLW